MNELLRLPPAMWGECPLPGTIAIGDVKEDTIGSS